jgi:hypothetical protein
LFIKRQSLGDFIILGFKNLNKAKFIEGQSLGDCIALSFKVPAEDNTHRGTELG